MRSDPDGILLQQYIHTHDPVAFDQLARRYRAMVFSIARRVTQSHHDAEDVAQGCFLELAKKASSIRSSIPAFLHSTATRRSIDLLRDKKRRQKYETEAVTQRPDSALVEMPAERSWDEISPEVDQAIDRLPEDLKTFVVLYFLRGLSVPDIVLETGLNRGMIERRLQVGVRRLRADLAKGKRIVTAGALAIGLKTSSTSAVPPSLTAATGRMALAAGLHSRSAEPIRPFGSGRWLLKAVAACALATALVSGAGSWLMRPTAKPLSSAPYDRMSRLYATYLPSEDVANFALHTSAMRNDPISFWRGSQPLFFEWCKSHCQDWLANSDAYTRCHASPNLEDAQRLATFVNTDDSASMPIQIEMLQGMIISRLATDQSLTASPAMIARIADELYRTYKISLQDDEPPMPAPTEDADILTSKEYVDSAGNLKSLILGRQDKLLAFLRPSPLSLEEVQNLLTVAIPRNAALTALCGEHPKVRDVRSCVRHIAVVTQGQLLLIVQLAGSGTLLELKQQTPSPAELAGISPLDTRPPARRAAEDAAALSPWGVTPGAVTPGGVTPVGWCEFNGQSFTVVPLDLHPQVYELRKDRWIDPVAAARCWAAATAVTHRHDPRRDRLLAQLTPDLAAQLIRFSDAYLDSMQQDFRTFASDARAVLDRDKVDALSATWLQQRAVNQN